MVTTIQVREDVLERLAAFKNQIGAKSMDETIRVLLAKAKSLEKSHFGSLKKLEPFRRDEIDRFG